MVSIVVSIHVIVCVTICVIILLQQGKGAEVGAVFGGPSQTVFGASGARDAVVEAGAEECGAPSARAGRCDDAGVVEVIGVFKATPE